MTRLDVLLLACLLVLALLLINNHQQLRVLKAQTITEERKQSQLDAAQRRLQSELAAGGASDKQLENKARQALDMRAPATTEYIYQTVTPSAAAKVAP